jgi:GAF domain-containing protein
MAVALEPMTPDKGIDEELLTRVLGEFARTLAGRFDVSEVLYRLSEHVIEILGVEGTGVSVVDKEGKLRPVTAPNELTRQLESCEEEHQQGPCVDAFHQGDVVVVADLAGYAERWPEWCREADRLGVQAVLGIPLLVRDESLGAMNIYSSEPRQWRDSEVRVARVLCDIAASYVSNASDLDEAQRTAEQLQEALDSRIIIEQAKGVLAAEQRISVDDAFQILRDHSRRHGASLRSVAEAVVNLGLRPVRRGKEKP